MVLGVDDAHVERMAAREHQERVLLEVRLHVRVDARLVLLGHHHQDHLRALHRGRGGLRREAVFGSAEPAHSAGAHADGDGVPGVAEPDAVRARLGAVAQHGNLGLWASG